MSATSGLQPGLEGVVAFETEIAEPDKDGGSLRYRGVDIEELVGRYPFENVWGLLVDEDIELAACREPEPYELQDRAARAGRPAGGDSPRSREVEARASSSTSPTSRRATTSAGCRRR